MKRYFKVSATDPEGHIAWRYQSSSYNPGIGMSSLVLKNQFGCVVYTGDTTRQLESSHSKLHILLSFIPNLAFTI